MDIIIERTQVHKNTSTSSVCMPIPSTTTADKPVYAGVPNTGSMLGQRRAHCWFNAGQSYSTLALY